MKDLTKKKLKLLSTLSAKINEYEARADEIRKDIFVEMKQEGVTTEKVDGIATVSIVKKKTVKYDKADFIKFIEENAIDGILETEITISKEFEDELKNGTFEFPDFVEIPKYEIIEKENLAIRFTK